jgi:hypothetical protein
MKRMALWLLLPLLGWESVPAAKAQAVLSGSTCEALKDITEKYFAALEAHDPSGLPLASNVKFTENGVELAVGKSFWQTAGRPLLIPFVKPAESSGLGGGGKISALREQDFRN